MTQLQTKERHKHLAPRPILWGGFALIMLILSISVFYLTYPFPSDEKISYFDKPHQIVFQGQLHQAAVLKEHEVYFPLTFIKDTIDPTAVYDEHSQSVIITTKNKVIQLPHQKLEYFINEKPFTLEIPVMHKEDDEVYISLEPLKGIYPVRYERIPSTGAVLVEKDGDQKQQGTVAKEANIDKLRVRSKPSLSSPFYSELAIGDTVNIESEKDKYYLVRTENGIAGYVLKSSVAPGEEERIVVEHETAINAPQPMNGPVFLTWEAVYDKNPPTSSLDLLQGVNVVSPTWFHLKNGAGDISSNASSAYVQAAHQKGFKVWGLFSNSFNPELTHAALSNFSTRQKMIRQLLQYHLMYHLDGINIDFENVNVEDGPLLTQFMRELTAYFHEANLAVSMDITFISSSGNWSKFYEREKLADIVDYLVVMAYDEHWATSQVSGSVASLPWVEKHLQKLLDVVPSNKLILGVPLYARLWKETLNADGSTTVTSKALKMLEAEQWLNEHELEPVLDEKSGQSYAGIFDEKDQALYKIWLENEHSLTSRVQLVHNYDLAGIATWSRHFGNEQAWEAMNHTLNQSQVKKQ